MSGHPVLLLAGDSKHEENILHHPVLFSKLENVCEHLTGPTNIEKSNPTSTLPGAPYIMEFFHTTH